MRDLPEIEELNAEPQAPASDLDYRVDLRPEYQYLVFRAGAEQYCLSVLEVEEVVEWLDPTPVPLAPPYLKGIINLRGAIIPVLDIAYGEALRKGAPAMRLVVALWNGEAGRVLRVGLIADEVFGTCLSSKLVMVEEPSSEGLHCRGMLQYADAFALAIDLSRLAETFPIPGI